jgi:SAM-dependent methyltransferase
MRRHYGVLCSEVYDLTKPVDGTYPDVPYYLARLSAPVGAVLEAGVGTGRLLVPLLRAGVAVEGLDASKEMLDVCRRNCDAAGVSTALYEGTLEDTTLPTRYDAVVLSFGSFMLFAYDGEARAALDAIRRALRPGGRLYVDVNVPASRIDLDGARKRVGAFTARDRGEITLDRQATWDADARIERTVLTYEKTRDGGVVAREEQDFPLRWWEPDELAALIHDAGFQVTAFCGDYDDATPPSAAQRWWCVTTRVR